MTGLRRSTNLKKSTTPVPEKHETVYINSNIAKFRLFIKRVSNKGTEYQSLTANKTIKSKVSGNNYFQSLINQLKMLSATLFPAINRFI